jgi:hypothetical protein
MSDDERFNEILRAAAQDYNRPPDTPREAMWARIEAARRAGAEDRHPASDDGMRAGGARPQLGDRRWWRWMTAIAATLVLGIAIGRFTVPERTRTAAVVPSGADSVRGTGRGVTVSPSDRPATIGRAASTETTDGPVAVPRGRVAVAPRPGPPPERESPVASAPYQAVTLQHLGRAEALLTSLRADSRAGRLDAQLSGWARELLSTTRLLLDSPAADDARLGRLLADLELVLAQIAQLPSERGAGELELIDQAVEQRDMLFRLRATVPSATVRAGT